MGRVSGLERRVSIPLQLLPCEPSTLLRRGSLLFVRLEVALASQEQSLIHVEEHFSHIHRNVENRLVPVQTCIPLQSWVYDWHDHLTVLGDHIKQMFIIPQE